MQGILLYNAESWHTRKDVSVNYTRTNESKIAKLRIKLNHDQQQVMVKKIIKFFFFRLQIGDMGCQW